MGCMGSRQGRTGGHLLHYLTKFPVLTKIDKYVIIQLSATVGEAANHYLLTEVYHVTRSMS